MLRQMERTIEAASTCCFVAFGMTDRVCLKSPPNTTVTPPNYLFAEAALFDDMLSLRVRSSASEQCLWLTGASSHIISSIRCITSASCVCFKSTHRVLLDVQRNADAYRAGQKMYVFER